jgi:hypothetical protein
MLTLSADLQNIKFMTIRGAVFELSRIPTTDGRTGWPAEWCSYAIRKDANAPVKNSCIGQSASSEAKTRAACLETSTFFWTVRYSTVCMQTHPNYNCYETYHRVSHSEILQPEHTVHVSLHTNKCTSITYCLKSVLIKIKTLYSLIAPTCFDTTYVIIREHSFFLAKITG